MPTDDYPRAVRGQPAEDTIVGQAKTSRVNAPLDRLQIETKALRYLERFDATELKLSRMLSQFVEKRSRELGIDPQAHLQTVAEVLNRYQQSGLIDDHRYGLSMGRTLSERGVSRQLIRQKLSLRGVPTEVIDRVLGELASTGTSEVAAAKALVRKRKLGPYRPAALRRDNYRRDLGVLARAGFDFETAKLALDVDRDVNESDF